jgi:hypothetical protein
MSSQVLKTPVRAPQANAHCERFIGTARRECLDWIIPLSERHLRSVSCGMDIPYNGERPHSALGPGLPDSSKSRATLTGHRLRARIVSSAALVSAACIITTSWNLSRHRFLRYKRFRRLGRKLRPVATYCCVGLAPVRCSMTTSSARASATAPTT